MPQGFRRAPSSSPAKASSAISLAPSSVRLLPVRSSVPTAPDTSSGGPAGDRHELGLPGLGNGAAPASFPSATCYCPIFALLSWLGVELYLQVVCWNQGPWFQLASSTVTLLL
uniref:Uncharacterized protein n=1 Tax=Oryctolagus cuniculus TaxID=9986 RepID=A0A5F9DL91_RABIT